jgi:hypothetical protein
MSRGDGKNKKIHRASTRKECTKVLLCTMVERMCRREENICCWPRCRLASMLVRLHLKLLPARTRSSVRPIDHGSLATSMTAMFDRQNRVAR